MSGVQFNRLWPSMALVLVILASAAPLLATDIPPLLDYHNHLARQYILHRLPDSPVLHQFYSVAWPATPYLAFDASCKAWRMRYRSMWPARPFWRSCSV